MKRTSVKTAYSGITANEFVALAAAVGMSSRQIADLFGNDDGNVRRWLRGTRPPPISVVMTLSLMRHFTLTPEQVRDISGEEAS
jgi:hypothetical protein